MSGPFHSEYKGSLNRLVIPGFIIFLLPQSSSKSHRSFLRWQRYSQVLLSRVEISGEMNGEGKEKVKEMQLWSMSQFYHGDEVMKLLFDSERNTRLYVLLSVLDHDTEPFSMLLASGDIDANKIIKSPFLKLWKDELKQAMKIYETGVQGKLERLFDRTKTDKDLLENRIKFLKGLSDDQVKEMYELIQSVFSKEVDSNQCGGTFTIQRERVCMNPFE
jgi:hypothetical protein